MMNDVVPIAVDFELDAIWEHSPQRRMPLDV
jgi:hypothetical protein